MLMNYGVKVVGVLVALWVSFRIANWLQSRVTKTLEGRDFDAALSIFFGNLTKWVLLVAAIVACLGIFGIDTTTFAAVLGAAGLAVGLAFQSTLSNFAAGVMLLTFRPFTVGDFVQVGGMAGTVKEIGLFTVTIDTLDNRRLIIPNAKVTDGSIENVTANDFRRVDIDVGVAYDADLSQVRKTLEAAAETIEGRDAKRGHQVFLKGLGDSSVDFQVRVWCKTEDYWGVWDRTVQVVKEALDADKITIPFPQLDLHVQDMPQPVPRKLAL
jgi:small conductance mechanosensitive channel